MNPWTAQSVAAERTRDLRQEAAAKRLARQTRRAQPAPQPRPLRRFIAMGRSARPRPA